MAVDAQKFEQAVNFLTGDGASEDEIFAIIQDFDEQKLNAFSQDVINQYQPPAQQQTAETQPTDAVNPVQAQEMQRAAASPGATFTPDQTEEEIEQERENAVRSDELSFTKTGTPIVRGESQAPERSQEEFDRALSFLQSAADTASFGVGPLVRDKLYGMDDPEVRDIKNVQSKHYMFSGIGDAVGYAVNPGAHLIRAGRLGQAAMQATKGGFRFLNMATAKLAAAEVGLVEGVRNTVNAVFRDEVTAKDAIINTVGMTAAAGLGTKVFEGAMQPIAAGAGAVTRSWKKTMSWMADSEMGEHAAKLYENFIKAPKTKQEAQKVIMDNTEKVVDLYKAMAQTASKEAADADKAVRPALSAYEAEIMSAAEDATQEALVLAAAARPKDLAANLVKFADGIAQLDKTASQNWVRTTKLITEALPEGAPKVNVGDIGQEVLEGLRKKYPSSLSFIDGKWTVSPQASPATKNAIDKFVKISEMGELSYGNALKFMEAMQSNTSWAKGAAEGDQALQQAYMKLFNRMKDPDVYGEAGNLLFKRGSEYRATKQLFSSLKATGKSLGAKGQEALGQQSRVAGRAVDTLDNDPLVKGSKNLLTKMDTVEQQLKELDKKIGAPGLDNFNNNLRTGIVKDLEKMLNINKLATPTKMKRALMKAHAGEVPDELSSFINYADQLGKYDELMQQSGLPKVVEGSIRDPLNGEKRAMALEYLKGTELLEPVKRLINKRAKLSRLNGGQETDNVLKLVTLLVVLLAWVHLGLLLAAMEPKVASWVVLPLLLVSGD